MIQPYVATGEVMPRDLAEAVEWLLDDYLPAPSPWWDALRDQDVRVTLREWPGVSERERARMVAYTADADWSWQDRLATCMARHRLGCLCGWPGGEEGMAGWRE